MAAIDDIIKWANTDIPAWQGDTVRRLLDAGDQTLSTKDYSEILCLAKAELGLEPTPTNLNPITPTGGMYSGVPASRAVVKLVSIDDVQNVNIIKSGQSLHFGENGVTVIFGDNGSGKSGYTRILKLACQARDKDDQIIQNVFAPRTGKATATLKIKSNNAEQDVMWIQGAEPDPILTNISVFDGRCARVITDERSEPIYLPYGCDVFPKLAEEVLRVKNSLRADIVSQQQIKDSAIKDGTPSALFLQTLSDTTKDQEIQAATDWTANDDQDLTKKIELSRASEATKAIAESDRLKKISERVRRAADTGSALFASYSLITNELIKNTLLDLKAAEEARKIAVAERQTPELLPGVANTNEWEILYNAAKKYSEDVAYIGTPFPKTVDALCVLCQQPLNEEAITRFERFKKYMTDATSTVLASKRTALSSLRRSIEMLSPLIGEELDSLFETVFTFDVNAAQSLQAFHSNIRARKTSILLLLDGKDAAEEVPSLPEWPSQIDSTLTTLANTVAQNAKVISDAARPDEFQKLTTDIAAMQSRKALSARKADIITYVKSARRNTQIQRAADTLGPREITLSGKALIKKHLTPAFTASLKTELSSLGAKRLPVSIKPTGGLGETGHEMLLEGTLSKQGIHMSQVLSEGEARVIALAGFLAELRLSAVPNPIVLDDPASSLDHVFTGKIAARLAQEGRERQVIVFTHNIAFLMELQDALNTLKLSGTSVLLEVHTVQRRGNFAGVTSDGAPWHAMKVKERIDKLKNSVRSISALFVSDSDKYNEQAAIIYSKLREAWECCVEDELLYNVVCRYRNSVETKKLNKVAIEDSDVKLIELNMSKTSAWMIGHDKSKGLHEGRPEPQEILSDIDVLSNFSKLVLGRHNRTENDRKAALGT